MSHSFFLVLRTLISLRVAEMDGAIVKALVKGNGKEFLKRIVWWMLIAVPATFTNSMVSLVAISYVAMLIMPQSYRTTKPNYHSNTDPGSHSIYMTNIFPI